MTGQLRRCVTFVGVVLLNSASLAHAQSNGLSRAVEALPQTPVGDAATDIRAGRLYEGVVDARITEIDRNRTTFGASDCINFTIRPRVAGPAPMRFVGPRSSAGVGVCPGNQGTFEDWTRQQAEGLLAIIFPSSLGASVLGREPGELHAQQLLLTTTLAIEGVRREVQGEGVRGANQGDRRAFAGGLFEFESMRRAGRQEGDSGWAWQGLYGITSTLSVQGRFAGQRQDITTHAATVSADYHPFIEIERTITWRFGGTARSGVVYSKSDAMDLGSLEFGGGGWASGFKDLGRVRVAGGTILEGSKSYVPRALSGGDDDLAFLADAINDRGIQYDLAFGGTAGIDTSDRTRVIVKVLENAPLSSRDVRTNSWLLSTGLSYRVGLPTLNAGYRFYSSTVLHGHSVFFQGNYDW